MMLKHEEELVLRRFFALCHLNTVCYASYRTELNGDRSSDVPTAQDYVRIDYNYVSMRRKTNEQLIQALIDQPGPRLEHSHIEALLEKWSVTKTESIEPDYTLDIVKRRLVKDTKCVVLGQRTKLLRDNCPRIGYPRLSISIHFLKHLLPDLMGEASVEKLDSLYGCVACYERPRDCILMPCNHVILCMQCTDTLKPTECMLCRADVEKIERIYLS